MNETSLRRTSTPPGYRLTPDDAPSNHSSMENVVPAVSNRPIYPGKQRLFDRQWQASDSTFRDAQEYQGRAQDLVETGVAAVPPEEGYDNKPDLPS